MRIATFSDHLKITGIKQNKKILASAVKVLTGKILLKEEKREQTWFSATSTITFSSSDVPPYKLQRAFFITSLPE